MRTLSRLILVSALLFGSAVLAARPVQEFQPPAEMTEEEKAALKAQQLGGNINSYTKDIQIKETPVPWAFIGLISLVFVVVTPFAVRAYLNTTKEIADTNSFGAPPAKESEEEA